jgi:Fe-S-cluster-containing hydrogenase component 2
VARRLVLDLAVCESCEECSARCSYFYRADPGETGLRDLREDAIFRIVCRRCTHASCARACPRGALERGADGVMVRHNLRCVSCKSCVAACPFGTIYPDLVPFYAVPCDRCAGRDDAAPACVASCAHGGLAWRDVRDDDGDLHALSETVAVRAPRWVAREEVRR